jgi:hypothetical protein
MQLKLGPLLRYVDETRATVWVESSSACSVEVLGHTATPYWIVTGSDEPARSVTPGRRSRPEVANDVP